MATQLSLHAQQKYWVLFTDKAGVSFDPYSYFDAAAIERRVMAGLPLYDSTDFPVNDFYIEKVSNFSDSIVHVTRWFNGISAWISADALPIVQALPFVKEIIPIQLFASPLSAEDDTAFGLNELSEDSLLKMQTESMGAQMFRDAGLTGKGIRIAVFDVGFTSVDEHPAFKHLRDRNQLLKTYDFIKKREKVYGYGTHGTMVLSNIAGRTKNSNGDSVFMGLAPDAEFLLARTERSLTEWREEEDSWLAAAEWADKNGAHIISSSLGYTNKRYFEEDMNGRTSLISSAANMAARKGILVVTAAGNEGTGNWKYICTPADADSALAIGGIDPATNYHISFSSYGPTSDGRIKPNVSAYGRTRVASSTGIETNMGTSFSTPLISGFAACAWQHNRSLSNMQLFQQIENSGNLFPYYDYAHGYGMPQASNILKLPKIINAEPAFTIDTTEFAYTILLHERYITGAKTQEEALQNKLLYYHITREDGFIMKYAVVRPESKMALTLLRDNFPIQHGTFRVFFDGYIQEINF